ncbi:hypothetical protein LRR18_01145 [Mangrovimonas sp. AS39]|uniref:hypothetical protein n=1 Tax=Mangrovimonas futianensis TaxID=2895523 RepID=UPI001E554E16|nr:hypothetical protein [Mangrovimonas futianensis]MCF1190172.1 hypothetical protein [Mangrovimonas futianensis]MCF1194077.1 hypothetical protein [Mangrovimonas futianensis]
MKQILLFLIPFLLLTSCDSITGEEIARLPINKVSTSEENYFEKETSLNLKKGDKIAFWSEMDFEYSGEESFLFRFRVYKNDEPFAILEFDPTNKNITIGEIKSTIGNKTKWSFTGKNKELKIKEDGKYTFKGILKTTKNPSLIVNKAIVVIKK